jgi:mannose/fructose-specific phosphotransferase system component IIA
MFHHQFHIIITTHSVLCQGYLKAAELILMNDQSGVTVLPFLENVPPEIFEEKVDEVIRQHASQPLLILTDLIGGTQITQQLNN